MRSKTPVYSLVRQLIRPSWNKYNLFNLSRKVVPSIHNKTMFQQKWNAKKETRSYHGEHLVERKFKMHLTKRPIGVANDNVKDNRTIPLASQTYAGLERRLDIAIFRALFASSVRQSRQMVVHGKVWVNQVKVKSPGFVLKPGDLFQVDPAAVIMNVSHPSSDTISGEEDVSSLNAEIEVSIEDVKPATVLSNRARSRQDWEEIGRHRFIPKPFMSAFAFIPSYLEVSYETCSAIYLRHPVARPGTVEVPSPLPASVHALAANLYSRGR